jgi:hypothetical protein
VAIKGSTRAKDDMTFKQRRLTDELDEIASLLKIDYEGAENPYRVSGIQ